MRISGFLSVLFSLLPHSPLFFLSPLFRPLIPLRTGRVDPPDPHISVTSVAFRVSYNSISSAQSSFYSLIPFLMPKFLHSLFTSESSGFPFPNLSPAVPTLLRGLFSRSSFAKVLIRRKSPPRLYLSQIRTGALQFPLTPLVE